MAAMRLWMPRILKEPEQAGSGTQPRSRCQHYLDIFHTPGKENLRSLTAGYHSLENVAFKNLTDQVFQMSHIYLAMRGTTVSRWILVYWCGRTLYLWPVYS
jgi:hypothetical protein